jgi:hypothetical protein
VLVGRDVVVEPGKNLGQRHRAFVREQRERLHAAQRDLDQYAERPESEPDR